MAKFKKGDRVRCIEDGSQISMGETGTIEQDNSKMPFIRNDNGKKACAHEKKLKLITDTYTPLTPKVGQKFRVIKEVRIWHGEKVPFTDDIEVVDVNQEEQRVNVKHISGKSYAILNDHLTTEYLEPVEEGVIIESGFIRKVTDDENPYLVEPIKNNKQTIMTIPKAIKKLLSKDLQALYKTQRINKDLELSSEGQSEYVNNLFNNKGDHTKAMAEMVETANDEIEEAKG